MGLLAMTATVAVVLARCGSKRIHRKNLREVGGRSLVARAAASGIEAGLRTIVSTDCEAVALEAVSAGAEVHLRPARDAADAVSSESSLIHVADAFGVPDLACVLLLQPTTPFRTAADTSDFMAQWANRRTADPDLRQAISVVPELSEFWVDDRGVPRRIREGEARRQQDRRPWFRESGAFYLTLVGHLRLTGSLIAGPLTMIPVRSELALEIDSEDDLELAAAIATMGRAPT